MRIRCEQCGTGFRVEPPAAARGSRSLRYRCPRCGVMILQSLEGPAEASPAESAPAEPAPAEPPAPSLPPPRELLPFDVPDDAMRPQQDLMAPLPEALLSPAPTVDVERTDDDDSLLIKNEGKVYQAEDLATVQRWIVERRVMREDLISGDGQQWEPVGRRGELDPFFSVMERLDMYESKAGDSFSSAPPLPDQTPLGNAFVGTPVDASPEDGLIPLDNDEPSDLFGEPPEDDDSLPRFDTDQAPMAIFVPPTERETPFDVVDLSEDAPLSTEQAGVDELPVLPSDPDSAPPEDSPVGEETRESGAAEPPHERTEPEELFFDRGGAPVKEDLPRWQEREPSGGGLGWLLGVVALALVLAVLFWPDPPPSEPASPPAGGPLVGSDGAGDAEVISSSANGGAEGDAAEGGAAEGDAAEGGAAEGDAAKGGAAEGGAAEGGAAEGGAAATVAPAPVVAPVKPEPKPQPVPKPQPTPKPEPEPADPFAGKSTAMLIEAGWDAMGTPEFDLASAFFREALRKDPGNARALYGKGYAAMKLKNDALALQQFCLALSSGLGGTDAVEAKIFADRLGGCP